MRIGYYVQGTADDAFIDGLRRRWCPDAELASPKFRGQMTEISFRREIAKSLWALRDKDRCDVLVVLTDSDVSPWRDVRKREWDRVPQDCRHICVFGVAERNIECWLAIDRGALAKELQCDPKDIPAADPSGFVKGRFGLGQRDNAREVAKNRVAEFVAHAPMKSWIEGSKSFEDFYGQARSLGKQMNCRMPNELEDA